MGLPAHHETGLSSSVKAHRLRIEQLHEVIELARAEIAVHEIIVRLAGDERMLATVGRCYTDHRFASTLARSPAKGFDDYGIDLPDGVQVIDPPEHPDGVLRARLRHQGWDVTLRWDLATGFSAAPDTRRLRQVAVTVVQPSADEPPPDATDDPSTAAR